MRPIYTHHRAARIYSKAKASTDSTVLTDCVVKLRHYGYPHHALLIEAKIAKTEVTTVPVIPTTPAKRKRSKKSG
jgi:hypothetical protein